MERRRVLVTAEQQLEGDGLVAILKNIEWIELISESVKLKKALKEFTPEEADMIIVDMNHADSEFLDQFPGVRNHFDSNKLFVLSASSNLWFISNLLKQGVNGYFLKTSSCDNLVDAIDDVFSGELFLPEVISKKLLEEYIHTKTDASNRFNSYNDSYDNEHDHLEKLTQREFDILKLLANGDSSSQIADQLCISELTVNTHRKHILKKLGFHNTTSLVRYVIENRIIA